MWHTPATIAIRVLERKQNFAEIEMQRNPTKPLALEIHSELFFQLNSSLVFAADSIKNRPPSQAFQQMQRLKNKLTWQSLKQLQENKMDDLWDIFIYTQK